jgi:hypothetical protein
MPVEAFIPTGQRTMLPYVIKPLHDQLMRFPGEVSARPYRDVKAPTRCA